MSKYCKAYALRVTYIDCLECETKECKQKGDNMVKRYLMLEPGHEVFLVFASKREKYDDNVVCKCVVKYATVYEETTVYTLRLKSIVAGKRKEHEVRFWVNTFMCENSNIDTGTRNKPNRYPVFTTKEGCLQWLKG